jgi:hypothetical protein
MTEEEWLECDDLRDLLDFAKTTSRSSRRTLTLLAVAGCRRLADLLPDLVCVETLDAAEAFADRAITAAQLKKVRDRLAPHCGGYEQTVKVLPAETANALRHLLDSDQKELIGAIGLSSQILGLRAVHVAGKMPDTLPYEAIPQFWYEPEFEEVKNAARGEDRKFLRDIFGNPFRKVKLNKKWLTDTAVTLSRQMYDAREFSAMPILADALQDAGCDNDDILAHCRDTSLTHVRGCWVVDLVLGKS